MISYIIEIIIISTWLYIGLNALRKHHTIAIETLIILAFSLYTSLAGEIVNELSPLPLFQQYGAFYPISLCRFPGFDFSVAILLLAGIYACVLNYILRYAYKLMGGYKKLTKNIVNILLYLALVTSCWLVEAFFSEVGYWQYKVFTKISNVNFLKNFFNMFLGIYVYYLLFLTPPILLARLITHKIHKIYP